jgi:hypothetical protein
MRDFNRILCPVDLSDRSRHAISHVVRQNLVPPVVQKCLPVILERAAERGVPELRLFKRPAITPDPKRCSGCRWMPPSATRARNS